MIELEGITKAYALGDERVPVLHGIDLRVGNGELVALTGASGSGKSTLMNILGCLDVPDAGSYRLGGRDVARLSEAELAQQRNRSIGFVFQSFHLLPRLDACDNVAHPLVYRGVPRSARRAAAREALVSASAWRSHAPSLALRACCWPTSPPATWTAPPPRRCCSCSRR